MFSVQKFNVGKIMKEDPIAINFEITGIKTFQARIWLAKQFFKIGSAIIGAEFDFQDNTKK